MLVFTDIHAIPHGSYFDELSKTQIDVDKVVTKLSYRYCSIIRDYRVLEVGKETLNIHFCEKNFITQTNKVDFYFFPG